MLAAIAAAGLDDHSGACHLGDRLDQPGIAFLPAVAAVYVDDQQPPAQHAISGLEPARVLDVVQLLLVPMRRDLPVAGARVLERRAAVGVAAVAPPIAALVAGCAVERENMHPRVPQVAIRLVFLLRCRIVQLVLPLAASTCPRP